MRQIFFIFLSLYIISGFISCKEDKLLVGFMLPNMNAQRYLIEHDEFIKKIKEYGGEVLFTNSNNDEKLQVQQLDSLINGGVKILVLDPVNRFTAAQLVRKAHDNNVKIISYDRLIANSNVDAYVAFDAQMTGRQMVEPILKLKPTGTYIILGGDKMDINAIGIAHGQMELLKDPVKNGQIKIPFNVFIERWDGEEARIELRRYLNMTSEVPDVIIAANDGIANGVVDVLKEYKLNGNIIVTANGGDLSTCKHIMDGDLFMSVYKPVQKLASLAAELAFKMVKNENTSDILNKTIFNDLKDIPCNLLETIPMNSENIRSTVIADGLIKESELNN